MQRNVAFFRPSLDREEEEAVCAVLRSGWLSSAQEAEQFEQEFASYVGLPHCLAVNSASAGLHLAVMSLHLPPGAKVALSPYTFAASANAIIHSKLEPLFVDIEPDGFAIDPNILEDQIKKDVRAIMPVHISGSSCNMDRILALGREYSLPIVEDAAHSFPAKDGDAYIGTRGTIGVYSFYANKTLTCAEGGMVVTRDKEIAEYSSAMRLQGMTQNAWGRYQRRSKQEYDVMDAGFKYNLPDVLAAIGRIQLRKAGIMHEKRREIARYYIDRLAPYDYLHVPEYITAHSWHLFILRLQLQKLRVDRDEFVGDLHASGIGTSLHYRPLHLMSYFAKRYQLQATDFPHALQRYQEVISLPIYPDMDMETVEYVCRSIIDIGNRHAITVR